MEPRAPSILVVDDTPANLSLLCGMLKERGYRARPVPSGDLALQAAWSDPPDLVLLDIGMPEMDGFVVCSRLKADARSAQITVIFLTAHTETSQKVRAFAVGGVDYVTKPFQIEEVHARVATHLELRRQRRELEESYARLREMEKLRDDLVHMVVHDMRSPLTALIMTLDLLATDVAELLPPLAAEDLRAAIRSAKAVSVMANQLLDVSRLEQGRLPLEKQPTDLLKVAAVVRANLAGMDAARPIEVSGPGPVLCNCDGALVQRVMENLLSNAIKHTPSGGQVRIRLAADGDRVRVAVQDSGAGVPPEARARIFEKFGAVAARKESKYHSAGLGLAFCKLAVAAHGGTIGIDDAEPQGSVFWFELPAE